MSALPTEPADELLASLREQVESTLEQWLAPTRFPSAEPGLAEAVRYGVLGGGKRIRPLLCLAATRACGGDTTHALLPACAVELIHAYSLIHDDLPAMDNDELRRGKATVHVAFGEATAILAGDALQALAFEWLAQAPDLAPATRLQLVRELASASGAGGMVGGQAIDLAAVGQPLDLAELENMHRRKTGALIEASVRMGAHISGAGQSSAEHLGDFARALGLAFQVQDDLLDIEGDTAVIGKPQGSDIARNKPTYPALLGSEGARRHLAQLLDQALTALEGFGPAAQPLRGMASFVVSRNH